MRYPWVSPYHWARFQRAESRNGTDLTLAVAGFESRRPVIVERIKKNGKRQEFDLDREILELEPVASRELRLTLAVRGNQPSVRPEEVLRAILGDGVATTRVVREELLVEWNRRLVNPILAASKSHGG